MDHKKHIPHKRMLYINKVKKFNHKKKQKINVNFSMMENSVFSFLVEISYHKVQQQQQKM